MAFRKFSQPTPMKAARFEGMPNLISSIQQNQLIKAKKQSAEAEAQQKVDKQINELDRSIEQGGYGQDQNIINELAKKGVDAYISDLNETGRVSEETSDLMQQSEIVANKSKKHFSEFRLVETNILNLSKNDPYFDFTLADAKRRNEEMKPINQRDPNSVSLEGPEYFMFDKYMADYITNQNKILKDPVVVGGKTVGHKGSEGSFIDTDGNINVTDQDAKSLFSSERGESIHTHYNEKLDAELDAEVASIRASGEAWTKGLAHNEIKTAIINNPELNTMDSRTFAERKLEMAKNDLRERARIDKLTNTNFVERKVTPPKPPGGDKEVQRQIIGEERLKVLEKIVKNRNKASLNTALGGLKGVERVEFTYEETDFVTFPKGEPEITGATLYIPNPMNKNLPPKPVRLKFGTPEDDRESAVIISKLKDDDISAEGSRVGGDLIDKLLSESEIWTPKKKDGSGKTKVW